MANTTSNSRSRESEMFDSHGARRETEKADTHVIVSDECERDRSTKGNCACTLSVRVEDIPMQLQASEREPRKQRAIAPC